MTFKSSKIVILFTAVLLAALIGSGASAADRITYDSYLAELSDWQNREQAALEAIDAEKIEIDRLKAEFASLEEQITQTWDAIYAELGLTRDDIEAFENRLADLEARVDRLAGLSPDQLLDRANELDEVAEIILSMLDEPAAQISIYRARLNDLMARIERLKNSLPRPQHDRYSVIRGDYLWKISGRQQIYSDPWKWMRIYSANRTEIDNPDLIFPGQQLRIPRQIDRDEHLVAGGESLSKIAGYNQVYGNPFQWTKIYQANKSGGFISDPNLIYPEQILSIPRN